MQRNTDGIKLAALKKQELALAKANAAIDKLLSENRAVNFESVSQTAGVTWAWLYRSELRARIEAKS